MTRLQTTVDPAFTPCPDPCPEMIRALEARLSEYLPEAQVLKVRRAYQVGAAAINTRRPAAASRIPTIPAAAHSSRLSLR